MLRRKYKLPHIELNVPLFKGYPQTMIVPKNLGEDVLELAKDKYNSKIFISLSSKEDDLDSPSLLGYVCQIESAIVTKTQEGTDILQLGIKPVERAIHIETELVTVNKRSQISLAVGVERNPIVNFSDNQNIVEKTHYKFLEMWKNVRNLFPWEDPGLSGRLPVNDSEFKSVLESVNLLGYILSEINSKGFNDLGIDLYHADTEYEILSVMNNLNKVIDSVGQENVDAEVEKELQKKVLEKMTEEQREYTLRKKLDVVKKELGEGSDDIVSDLKNKLKKGAYPDEVVEFVSKSIKKLERINKQSVEFQVQEQHINTVLDFPWAIRSQVNSDLKQAKELLDKNHYGMEDVKKRILRFLAVKKQNPNNSKGTILCLSGPPGVGKTSICKNIASSLGLEFARLGLGGVSDESEIRGHRRTYVGAMEGKIASTIMKTGKSNPLIVLDEIDKLGKNHGQDAVQAALLEVLDPEQNKKFNDHYFEVPVDLSNVFFIATANDVSNISGPLRDRMEFVELSSYLESEKIEIAKKHLIPDVKKDMNVSGIELSSEGLLEILRKYTRESGVRNLKQKISSCFGEAILEQQLENEKEIIIDKKYVAKTLGNRYIVEQDLMDLGVGRSIGMAWTPVGGDVLYVESAKTIGTGLTLTGQLGSVMKESAQIAVTVLNGKVKDHLNNVHIHFPDGATPKDGPSAGITLVTSLYSLANNQPMKKGIAMTGEVSLKGDVLPVGGIKEKVIAAYNKGIKTVILPKLNEKDLSDIPEEVVNGLNVHLVSSIDEVLELSFNKN